jgi:hypothetical protein
VPEQVEQHVTAEKAGGAGQQDPAGRQRLGHVGERQAVGEAQIGEDLFEVLAAGPGTPFVATADTGAKRR